MSLTSVASTRQSLRTLLAGAIDYAGMYPPAGLPLPEAWANYLSYRQSSQAWMLGHFVVPLAELVRLNNLADKASLVSRPTLAVVVPPLPSACEWLAQFRRQGAVASSACEIAALECKLPGDVLAERDSAATCAFAAEAAALAPSAMWYFEGPADAEEHIAGLAQARDRGQSNVGFKLRTGGLEPAAFPSLDDVAWAIDACRRQRVPWKATAGLHHPLRQLRREVQASMHGFVNVLVAAALAEAHALPPTELARILAGESAGDFHFTDEQLAWDGLAASLDNIRRARQSGLRSFGSCSFMEPIADLGQLGWLTRD
jgi:hypothetical protein